MGGGKEKGMGILNPEDLWEENFRKRRAEINIYTIHFNSYKLVTIEVLTKCTKEWDDFPRKRGPFLAETGDVSGNWEKLDS